MEVFDRLKSEDPRYETNVRIIESQIEDYIKEHQGMTSEAVIKIPVVVHVVYNTTAQNISTAQIQSQIDVLNKDFQKKNSDTNKVPAGFKGLAANCQISFCLATRTPQGASTTGIIRKSTTKTSFSTNDYVKYSSKGGDDAWDCKKYLNLWVCNLSGGVLGYAQFPGGPAATDGVVIGYNYFGTTGTVTSPYNLGRTATHEVGHWLNLYHIWGDDGTACSGSDLVTDTPNQAGENYGKPTYPKTDACTRTSPGVMFMNYMDYVDDAAMMMFSTGQSTRMTAAINTSRPTLLTSNGCTPLALNPNGIINYGDSPESTPLRYDLIQNYPNPFNPVTKITFSVPVTSNVTLKVYDVLGNVVKVLIDGETREAGAFDVDFDGSSLSSGVYFYKLEANTFTATRRMILNK